MNQTFEINKAKVMALLQEMAGDKGLCIHDTDCDDCVYALKDIIQDKSGSIIIQGTMWSKPIIKRGSITCEEI